jgi:acyl-CoA thioester hydrolase
MDIKNNKLEASINFNIKTYEIDIAGHVSNIVYVKWLEDLRCKLFEQIIPIDKLLNEDLYPVVTSTTLVYKKQLKLGDNPFGFIWIENIKHNMMILKFNFISDEKICVFAEQKCVVMNLKKGTIDKEQLKNLALFE